MIVHAELLPSAVTLALCAALAACLPEPRPTPHPLPGTACEAAGARLEQLGCRRSDGAPLWTTPGGVPFADACQHAASDGRDWHPECIAVLDDCAGLDRAYRGGCP
jgi:hypothetical protein